MKKILIALGAGALMLAACGHGNKFSVQLPVDSSLKGQIVALIDVNNGDTVASALATDTIVTIDGTVEKPMMIVAYANTMPIQQFVLEPGKITFDANGMAVGTKSNDAFAKYAEQVNSIIESMNSADSEKSEEILNNEFVPAAVKFIEENPNSPYNQVAFGSVAPFMNVEQMNTVFKNDTAIANNPDAQRLMANAENKAKTGVGSKYVDVEFAQADSTLVKLSDYIVPGRYTLIDFWASWCQPCRKEIPGLIEIYNKYHDAGIDVVGVAVWDDPAQTEKAMKELNINYPVVKTQRATSRELTDAYGIMGIPCIMLIDPQGTIVGRDLFGDQITEAVEKAILAKRR